MSIHSFETYYINEQTLSNDNLIKKLEFSKSGPKDIYSLIKEAILCVEGIEKIYKKYEVDNLLTTVSFCGVFKPFEYLELISSIGRQLMISKSSKTKLKTLLRHLFSKLQSLILIKERFSNFLNDEEIRIHLHFSGRKVHLFSEETTAIDYVSNENYNGWPSDFYFDYCNKIYSFLSETFYYPETDISNPCYTSDQPTTDKLYGEELKDVVPTKLIKPKSKKPKSENLTLEGIWLESASFSYNVFLEKAISNANEKPLIEKKEDGTLHFTEKKKILGALFFFLKRENCISQSHTGEECGKITMNTFSNMSEIVGRNFNGIDSKNVEFIKKYFLGN